MVVSSSSSEMGPVEALLFVKVTEVVSGREKALVRVGSIDIFLISRVANRGNREGSFRVGSGLSSCSEI